jgi:hypothetical protein
MNFAAPFKATLYPYLQKALTHLQRDQIYGGQTTQDSLPSSQWQKIEKTRQKSKPDFLNEGSRKLVEVGYHINIGPMPHNLELMTLHPVCRGLTAGGCSVSVVADRWQVSR